ncbi:MAG TPA: hypothetical protein VK695_03300 [Steroidobacteraceae bacterium]|jgi:hypothetical protein|nr:hypothetical protein [Steroidobacteraceae bacterium]
MRKLQVLVGPRSALVAPGGVVSGAAARRRAPGGGAVLRWARGLLYVLWALSALGLCGVIAVGFL